MPLKRKLRPNESSALKQLAKDTGNTEYSGFIYLNEQGVERIDLKRGKEGAGQAPIPENFDRSKDWELFFHTHPYYKGIPRKSPVQKWGNMPSDNDILFTATHWQKDENKKHFIIPATGSKAIKIYIKNNEKFEKYSSEDYNFKGRVRTIYQNLRKTAKDSKEFRKQFKHQLNQEFGIDFKWVQLDTEPIEVVEPSRRKAETGYKFWKFKLKRKRKK